MKTHSAITGATQIVGLLGWPVSHSLSPAMHNAAFDYLGLDWRYVPLPVDAAAPAAIPQALGGLRALGLRGANVTVPHKQAVMPYVHHRAPAAQAIGAVNTLVVEPDGTFTGDNTDAAGFVSDLRAHGVELEDQHVLVLGAGGSARAIVYGLARAKVARIAVANRTRATAEALVAALQPLAPECRMTAFVLPDDLSRLAPYADLIVNCTTLGMTPHVDTNPWPEDLPFHSGQVVYDLVYNPPHTQFLRQAVRDGAQAIGGLGMLVWQGALAFERWTGQPAPVDVMRSAAAAHFAARTRRRAEGPGAPGAAHTEIDLHVRLARPEDAPRISTLNGYVQRLHADVLPHYFKQPTATTFAAEYVLELLAKPDTVMFVVELAGAVAGYLYGDVAPAMETNATYTYERFYIHHIAVAPDMQGHGCGSALLDAAKQEARRRGIPRLALATWDFNRRAQRFFEGQGFVHYGHRMWLQGI
jgi:shikimate dehydrogenase